MIMGLRDAAYAKAPYLQTPEDERAGLSDTLVKEGERPLVGDTGDDWFYMPENGSAVIDPDVLWSCTNCGACVQQCPVDIEHVDHIVDMRRYAVLVESNFPAELNGLFKGLENKGNPWNMSPNARLDWAKGLDFEVKVVGESIESLDEVDWLFWVGCAGAYEDRAKKTTRAVAELLDMAGVSFGVLGNGETCTGDPARRAGNEFVFQGLAQQNVETFKEFKVKKVVSTCAHCFNTLKNEYKDFGVELEVVHHTQLLNRLVREGKLTPVNDGAGAHKRSITYHDPCFIGRHNGVYTPPRELLEILPGAEFVEMERNSEKSFCCGAGGARMWMEENIGERINVNRTVEAVGTGADQIAVGCPFCRVMLSDGLTAQQAKGEAREEVEVLDVAQMLLASVKGEMATKVAPGAGTAAAAAAAAPAAAVETKAEPEAGDETITEDTVVATEDAGPAAKASGGSSLFDTPAEPETATAQHEPARPRRRPRRRRRPAARSSTSAAPLSPSPSRARGRAREGQSGVRRLAVRHRRAGAEAEPDPSPSPSAEGRPGRAAARSSTSPPPSPRPRRPSRDRRPRLNPEPRSRRPSPHPQPPRRPPSRGRLPLRHRRSRARGRHRRPSRAEPEAEQPEPEATTPEPKAEPAPAATPTATIPEGGSLFDIAAPEPSRTPSRHPQRPSPRPRRSRSRSPSRKRRPRNRRPSPHPQPPRPPPSPRAARSSTSLPPSQRPTRGRSAGASDQPDCRARARARAGARAGAARRTRT